MPAAKKTKYEYYYGNTAPKLPDYEKEYSPKKKNNKNSHHKRNVKRRHQGMNISNAIIFSITIISLSVMCCYYLYLQASINTKTRLIEKQEELLTTLQEDNFQLSMQLEQKIDLPYVYYTATRVLGMTWPKNEQIIYYEDTNSGYVHQGEDIPTY